MEAWARNFLDAYTAAIPEAAQAMWESFEQDAARRGQYKLEDFVQMLQGSNVMVAEYLEHGTRQILDDFIATVVPGIISQGESLEMFISQATFTEAILTITIFSKIKPKYRKEAGAFWAQWNMMYFRDAVKAGYEAVQGMNK